MASSSSSPCAACKFLRRKCVTGCVFAPYFPQEDSARFISVHRAFGASNVAKILNDLSPLGRRDAVASLCFEAEVHLQDPVQGCVGYIHRLHRRLLQLQQHIVAAKAEMASCIPSPIAECHHHPSFNPQHFQAGHGAAAPAPWTVAQEFLYPQHLQIMDRPEMIPGSDPNNGHRPLQIDAMRYNGGVESSSGPATVLALAPQQQHDNSGHHQTYFQERRQQ